MVINIPCVNSSDDTEGRVRMVGFSWQHATEWHGLHAMVTPRLGSSEEFQGKNSNLLDNGQGVTWALVLIFEKPAWGI